MPYDDEGSSVATANAVACSAVGVLGWLDFSALDRLEATINRVNAKYADALVSVVADYDAGRVTAEGFRVRVLTLAAALAEPLAPREPVTFAEAV